MRHITLLLVTAALPFAALAPSVAGEPVVAEAAAHANADISKADLDAAIKAKTVTLIDCNGTDSYAAGHIPGAIDFTAKGKELAALLPKDKAALIVSYCGGPKCGAYKSGADAAKALGYTNVKHFSEGISGWKKSGGLVEK